MPSNTRYANLALCEKLARDLDLDVDELIAKLPRARTFAAHLWNPNAGPHPGAKGRSLLEDHNGGFVRYGMGNTDEEVR